ncbi:acetyl-CoA carboxylase carboxyltransferase subunit alpha [candidate division KSB1 bacterium]|nr:acetyl-CoA carboxylase carboxyltransferase subunit alpha [candidate division KSB1 bacterium]
MIHILEFEKPIVELEKKIDEMREYAVSEEIDMSDEIIKLEKRCEKLKKDVYSNLSRWQRVQLARHPERPYTLDYAKRMCSQFIEIHGDRLFADDKAIVGGLATIEDTEKGESRNIMLIGHQKGRGTKSNLYRNFGMPNPEGYRKALRLMKLAAKFDKPIVTLIDTPGAFPGKGSEERGVAEAIAVNLFEMSTLPVPVICIVIGEGGSGGALALAIGDRVLMLENAIYSVISPEGCASILLRDPTKAPAMADSLKVTASDVIELGVVDGIIKEPVGGAHRNYDRAAEEVKSVILRELNILEKMSPEERIEKRIDKFGQMGIWIEKT